MNLRSHLEELLVRCELLFVPPVEHDVPRKRIDVLSVDHRCSSMKHFVLFRENAVFIEDDDVPQGNFYGSSKNAVFLVGTTVFLAATEQASNLARRL